LIFFCIAHTQDVQFSVCTTRDDFKTILTKIEKNRKKNSSLTCVFGPVRHELDRQDLRQSNLNNSFVGYYIFIIR
jgi:hypothetical protein